MNNLINTNKKYFLIYLISIGLIVTIWNVTIGPPETIIIDQIPDTHRLEIEPKEVFGYVNEMLTTIIGMCNIIAFGYQMRDRKRKKLNKE
mgnify:CR=1 FL=1|tara:strand:+ start:310 stop:579 length:270 start_codon:yes stop_codon:yes gene_type:complete